MAGLHLLPHTEAIDGVQRAALDFSRGLAAAGEAPRVLALGGGDNLAAWEAVVTVEPAPYLGCSPRHPGAMTRTALAARHLGTNFDVVVAHRLDLLNAAAIFAARARRPLVFHAHNGPPPWLRWGDPLRVPGSRRVERLIVASEFMRGEWEAVVGEVPIVVVPYPIDLGHFAAATPRQRASARAALGVGEDEFVAAFVGRLEDSKGPHVLLDAARLLHEGGRPMRVVIQGAPGRSVPADVAASYRERCAAAAGSCPVTWVPPGPDVRDAVNAADVCVVPSVWPEPSGLTVAEALATGTPLVASAVGGIPEQMPAESVGARLVPPDDPGALAAALMALREDPPSEAERRALRDHVEASRNLPTITRHYRSALDGGP